MSLGYFTTIRNERAGLVSEITDVLSLVICNTTANLSKSTDTERDAAELPIEHEENKEKGPVRY